MLLGAIALMVLAVALVAAELFVPSHGVMAALALLAAVASVVMAYQVTPGLGVVFTIVLVVATPIVFYWAVRIYPSTSVGQKVLLMNPQPQQVEAFKEEATEMESLVGKRGVATTLLRPAGNIEIEGKWVEAQSESEMIEPGASVEVIRISGLKAIVKPVPA